MKQIAFILFSFICLTAAVPSYAHAGHDGEKDAKTHMQDQVAKEPGCTCHGSLCHFLQYETAASEATASGHNEEEGHCRSCECSHHTGNRPAGVVIQPKGWDEEDQRYINPCVRDAADIFKDILQVKAATAERPDKRDGLQANPIFSIKWYATVLSMEGDDEDSETISLPASSESPIL